MLRQSLLKGSARLKALKGSRRVVRSLKRAKRRRGGLGSTRLNAPTLLSSKPIETHRNSGSDDNSGGVINNINTSSRRIASNSGSDAYLGICNSVAIFICLYFRTDT